MLSQRNSRKTSLEKYKEFNEEILLNIPRVQRRQLSVKSYLGKVCLKQANFKNLETPEFSQIYTKSDLVSFVKNDTFKYYDREEFDRKKYLDPTIPMRY